MLLRTFDRAQRVYQAMCLRGFSGEYITGSSKKMNAGDLLFIVGWGLFLITMRTYDIPMLLGSLFTGVITR